MICFEDYSEDRKPNKLPCDHFFCAICTDQLGQGGAIRCPVCQQVTQFEDVRTDFRAIQFLDIMKKMQDTTERLEQMSLEGRRGPQASAGTGSEEEDEDNGLCDFCKMNEAQSWCDDCKKRLCVTCAAAHPNIPVFESHKIAPLVDGVSRFADVLTIEIEKAKDQIQELRDARAKVDAMFVAVKEEDDKADDWLNEKKVKYMKVVSSYFRELKGIKTFHPNTPQHLHSSPFNTKPKNNASFQRKKTSLSERKSRRLWTFWQTLTPRSEQWFERPSAFNSWSRNETRHFRLKALRC